MSVGVMKDYKLRDLRTSHTLVSLIFVYYESMKRNLKIKRDGGIEGLGFRVSVSSTIVR